MDALLTAEKQLNYNLYFMLIMVNNFSGNIDY